MGYLDVLQLVSRTRAFLVWKRSDDVFCGFNDGSRRSPVVESRKIPSRCRMTVVRSGQGSLGVISGLRTPGRKKTTCCFARVVYELRKRERGALVMFGWKRDSGHNMSLATFLIAEGRISEVES